MRDSFFFFQVEDVIRYLVRSRGLGDVYKRQTLVEADGYINTDILSIKVDKGAVVSLDVRALKVKSEILGCGSVRLSGTVGTFLSDCEGCGMIDLAEMRVLDRAI